MLTRLLRALRPLTTFIAIVIIFTLLIVQHGLAVQSDVDVSDVVDLPFIDADQPIPHTWEFYSICHDHAMIIGEDIDRSNIRKLKARLNTILSHKSLSLKLSDLRRKIICLYLQSGLESQQAKQARNDTSVHHVLNRIAVHRMMLNYFERYIHEARNRQYIFHHHISKNSGTAICAAMTSAKCEVTKPNAGHAIFGINCWCSKFEDRLFWSSTARQGSDGNYSCTARLGFVNETGLSVMSNENYLTDDVGKASCSHEGALSIEVVRDPLKRMLSHENEYVRLKYGEQSGCAKNRTMECFWSTIHGDFVSKNYQVKALAGRHAWLAPETTEEHYLHAVANLKSFDVLLVIGRHENSYTVPWAIVMQVGMGLLQVRNVGGRAGHDKLVLTYDQLSRFRRNNVWDYALFHYAQRLERLDMIAYNRTASLCKSASARAVAPTACAALLHDMETLESLGALPATCGWPRRKTIP